MTLAVVALVAARLPADEIAHPLDVGRPEPEPPSAAWMGDDGAGRAPVREGEPWPS